MDVLTAEELAELSGYVRPAYQLRWLAQNGIRHWRRKDGLPVVPRSALNDGDEERRRARQGPHLDGLARG